MEKSNALIKYLQIILTTLSVAALGITTYIAIAYYQKQSALIPRYETLMTEKTKEYAGKIINYVDGLEKSAISLSELPAIQKALGMASAHANNTEQFKQSFKELEVTVKEFSFHLPEPTVFKDIMLVTTDGAIILSLQNSKYLNTNIHRSPIKNNQLGYSLQRIFMSLTPDISEFYFDEILQELALFISVPVFKDGIIEGIIIAQVNQIKIYEILQNYLGLGNTGEFVLGNRMSNDIQIIAPTRLHPNIAFKESGIYKPAVHIPLQLAVNGETGTSLGTDYRQEMVIASWQYITNAGWGLVTKIDYAEVINMENKLGNYLLFMIMIMLALWSALILSSRGIRHKLLTNAQKLHRKISPRAFFQDAALLFFVISAGIGGYIYYEMIKSQNQALIQAQAKAQERGTQAVKDIEFNLGRIALMVQGVSESLSSGQLSKDDISINISRKLNEESQLFAFCVAYNQPPDTTNQTSFAPYMVRKNGDVVSTQLADVLKSQALHQNFMELPWFKESIKQKKGLWIQPIKEFLTGEWVIMYAEPFFAPQDTQRQNPLGAVSAMYALEKIKPMLAHLSIGETGFSFIVNKEGKFIFHPAEKYESHQTLFTLAEREGNETLNAIDQNIIQGKEGIESYKDNKSNQLTWISYQPIQLIDWSLAVSFIQNEITPPAQQLHHQMIWLIICAVLALLFLCFACSWLIKHKPMRAFSFASSAVLVLGILGIWRLVQPQINVKNGIIVNSAIGLDAYVEELRRVARQRHEPEPIPLKVGIYLYSWKLSGALHIEIAGTIWQEYDPKKHLGLDQDFDLPEATRVTRSDRYEEQEKGYMTVGWNVDATIAQRFDYSKYPLDSQRIRVIMDHKDLEKNVLQIPDLSGYKSMRPTDLPGLSSDFIFYGFKIQRAFFSIEKMDENVDFGIKRYNTITDHMKLNYNIIIVRDLLNALIVFFLPLMVILFSLFAIFSVTGRIGTGRSRMRTFVSLTGYTGLLFALITLHHVLRSEYPSGNVLYIEYFFFYTYITILILIVHGAIVQAEVYQNLINEKITPIMKNLFWPIEVLAWFITTVVVFYN
jgi:hypothetical protein